MPQCSAIVVLPLMLCVSVDSVFPLCILLFHSLSSLVKYQDVLEVEVEVKNCFFFFFSDKLFEPHHENTCFFAYAKTKAQISSTVTGQLISTFVFAT